MREQIQKRFEELKHQFEAGQSELQQLEVRESYLREMLLRITGAMQVLEELMDKEKPVNGAGLNVGEARESQSHSEMPHAGRASA